MSHPAFSNGIKLLKQGAQADEAWKRSSAEDRDAAASQVIAMYEEGVAQLAEALASGKFANAQVAKALNKKRDEVTKRVAAIRQEQAQLQAHGAPSPAHASAGVDGAGSGTQPAARAPPLPGMPTSVEPPPVPARPGSHEPPTPPLTSAAASLARPAQTPIAPALCGARP